MKASLKTLLSLLLVMIILVGCTPTSDGSNNGASDAATESSTVPEPTVDPALLAFEERLAGYSQLGEPTDDNYRTWYQLIVYTFCDSNGDGIGDFNGVRSKLDDLQRLGVTGIWLLPIHPSGTYHKYDVDDYYAVDPSYGTMGDFEALVEECHQRGIRVILDLVVNHTSSKNAWFTEAVDYIKSLEWGDFANPDDCKYFNYYNFSLESPDGYCGIPGTSYYYEGRFWSEMPDLNLGSDLVREEIKNVMKFWLDKGVDGFRVDAAKEFYTGDSEKNIEVMNWLQTTAESLKPDVYMVAEVWSDFTTVTEYYKSGFTSIFNYPFANASGKIISTIRNAGNANMIPSYAVALQTADQAYSANNPDYIDAPFLSNHDIGRINGFAGGNADKIKMACAMNLLMSGSAFVYYGEEIAMPGSGNDPSKRAPMYWNAERNNGVTTPAPECKLPDEYVYGSFEDQKNDPNSIYSYYREIIAIRNALPVISHGKITAEEALNVGCISAQRKTWGDEECIILLNFNTEAAEVDLSAYADWHLAVGVSTDGSPVELNGTTLSFNPFGIAILRPNK